MGGCAFSAQGTFLGYATSTKELTLLRTDPWEVPTQTTVGREGTGYAEARPAPEGSTDVELESEPGRHFPVQLCPE